VVDDAEPKYLNSPETPIFRKSEVLFGLFEAHSALRSQRGPRTLFVVEGYMDVLALSQGGVPGAVATMGTAVSGAHIAQLRRLASEVVFVFDGDAAGDKAARAALEASLPCAGSGTLFSFVRLPDRLDPDDVIQRDGRDSWLAQPRVALCDFLMSCAQGSRDLSSAEDRAAFLTEGKRLALLLPQGSDLRRIVMADLYRAAGLESPIRASVNARRPAGATRFSSGSENGRNPLAATSNRTGPEMEAYVRIREACERQPTRTAELAADIVAHLERMFARDAPGAATALPTEAALLLDYVQHALTASDLSDAIQCGAPSPTDVAILDNVHGVLEGLEEAYRARLETARLATEWGRETWSPSG
jgi:DNA primase